MRYIFCAFAALFAIPATTNAAVFGGVEFPLGELSFADAVVSYEPGTGGVQEPFNNPLTALGVPDFNPNVASVVSLGNGGTLILEFADNLLVDQDSVENGLDLFIFEAGRVEPFSVSISQDGFNFINLGTVSGQPTGFDIKPFVNEGDKFKFVKLVDANSQRTGAPFPGSDTDAVGAIGSIPVPESSGRISWILGLLTFSFAVCRRNPLIRKYIPFSRKS